MSRRILLLPTLAMLTLCACGEAMITEQYGPDGQLLMSLTKGQPGAQIGDSDYCADPANRCDVGEGSCSNHNQCLPGLKCALRGEVYGLPGLRVCHPEHCVNSRLDTSLGEIGVDCGGVCGACPFPNTCYNGLQDFGEESIDCGGPSCGACVPITLTVNSPTFDVVYTPSLPPRATGRVDASDLNQRVNRLIEFEIDSVPVGSTLSTANGTWEFRLPSRPAGVYTLTTRVNNGTFSTSDVRTYRVATAGISPVFSQLMQGGRSTSISTRAADIDNQGRVATVNVVSPDLVYGDTTIVRQPASGTVGAVTQSLPDGTPQWATRIASDGTTTLNAVKYLSNGELVVMGDFTGTIDLGEGPIAAVGAKDAFIAKLSATGQLVWGRVLSATGNTAIRTLEVSPQDEIVAIANFTGVADVGGALPLVSAGDLDMYVLKLNASGAHIWSRSFGGPTADVVNDLGVDAQGNIYLTGSYGTDITFDTEALNGTGSTSAFLVKLAPGGKTIWAKDIGGTVYDVGVRLGVSSAGEPVVGGIFSGDVNFGSGTFVTSTTDNFDIFLARYTTHGAHIWSRQIQAILGDSVNGLEVGPLGTVYATGIFRGAINLGAGARTAQSAIEGFLVSYNANGSFASQRFFTANREITPRSLELNAFGAVVISGDLIGDSVNFGTGNLTPTSRRAGFFATYR